ncbi:MAG: hypothetical protein JO316_09815 [Abitibacteriaceae bacterium]|nr:hypothetical protein [Abditibacteriaceae bacterium]
MIDDPLPSFPAELLTAEVGTIAGTARQYSITIKLLPFHDGEETINETLRIDKLPLLAERIEELPGRQWAFPSNPQPGYVETSIYMWTVHNPIEVESIRFGKIENGYIEAELQTRFVFEYEGGHSNLNKTFTLPLKIES